MDGFDILLLYLFSVRRRLLRQLRALALPLEAGRAQHFALLLEGPVLRGEGQLRPLHFAGVQLLVCRGFSQCVVAACLVGTPDVLGATVLIVIETIREHHSSVLSLAEPAKFGEGELTVA